MGSARAIAQGRIGDSRGRLTFGNPVERLGSTGSTVLSAAAFDDYGKAYIIGTVSPWDPYSQFGAQAGYYADAYTGLELAGSRYYDISTGRWLSRDPAGYAGGINEYEYAGNNPLGNVDPSGLCSVQIDSPGGAPLFVFDNEDVGDGLETGLAATGSAFSFGLWNGGKWRCHLGYAGAYALGSIGANAVATAATAGLGEAFAAARAARAVQAAGEIGAGAGEAAEATEGPATLYHYTNEEGMNGIVSSNDLNASTLAKNPADVRYGNGQYLSDIVPGTKAPAHLSRSLINNPFQGAKFCHYVEIDVRGLNVVQGRPGVFVVPNEEALDLTGRLVGYGVVP